MAEFIDLVKILFRKKGELRNLEKTRTDAFSAAGQNIAAKQAEVTKAERDVENFAG